VSAAAQTTVANLSEIISVSYEGPIATITLNTRTMAPVWFDALDAACDAIADAPSTRVVILRGGHPKAFCYGLDLPKAFSEWGALFQGGDLVRGRTKLRQMILKLQRPFKKLAALRIPTIAAVHGHCLGGGVDLISACDLRLATEDAIFSVREVKIAIVADLGSLQRLPSIIGLARTRELAYTGRDIDAAKAERYGLVNEVLADKATLDEAALKLAHEIAANPPLAVQGVKAVLDYAENHSIDEGLDYVAAWNAAFLPSQDLAEAMSAFMARRDPIFKGH
jgi:enoyl-CoA hydratase